MEVTTENFARELPNITRHIEECDFVTFDTEFSGLGKQTIGVYDTPAQAYQKTIKEAGRFMLMQFGLCTFRYDAATHCYRYAAWNCYIFPRLPRTLLEMRDSPKFRITFEVQPDSLMMLSKHNFDYNKWVGQGVGYLRTVDAEQYRERIMKRHEKNGAEPTTSNDVEASASNERKPPQIPNNLRLRIVEVMNRVDVFMKEAKVDEPLALQDYSAFERRLIYNMLEYKYPKRAFTSLRRSDLTLLVYYCRDDEHYAERRQVQKNEGLSELDEAKGFVHVIDAIAKSGKPVVMHNALMDVLYTYRTFIDDLPPTWRQFCADVLKVFPHIYDTKFVCAGEDFVSALGRNPSLFVLNDKIRHPPFGDVHYAPMSTDLDVGDNARHTAAYDAHITGRVFIALTRFKHDQIVNAQNPNSTTSSTPATHAQVMDVVAKFYDNKIARVGRIVDMSAFDLLQPDEMPDRSHVFYMQMSDSTWKTDDIRQLMSPYGDTHVHWIDDCSCYVQLNRRQAAITLQKALCTGAPVPVGNTRTFTLTPEVDTRYIDAPGNSEMMTEPLNEAMDTSSASQAPITGRGRNRRLKRRTDN